MNYGRSHRRAWRYRWLAKTRTTTLVWLRRAVQTAFLLLFLYLFLETVYHPINRVGGGVKLFFQLDPLVMLNGLAGLARAGRGHAAFSGHAGRHLPVRRPAGLRVDLPLRHLWHHL